jgi:hypothetical protein
MGQKRSLVGVCRVGVDQCFGLGSGLYSWLPFPAAVTFFDALTVVWCKPAQIVPSRPNSYPYTDVAMWHTGGKTQRPSDFQ